MSDSTPQTSAPAGPIVAGLTPAQPESVPAHPVRARWVPLWFAVLWANGKARVGIVMLVGFVAVAVFAPVIEPHDPQSQSFDASLGVSGSNLLGTTAQGQDILSLLIRGTRTSLIVGLLGGVFSTLIAMLIGMVAGYLQGWVDEILSFFINLALVIPVLPLMVTIAAYSPVRGISLIIFIIAITGWAWGARLKRSQIITLRTRDYVTAARFAGDGAIRIIFREIMPNMTSLVVAGFMGSATAAIAAEAGLEFLGLGDPTTISWGTMLFWAEQGSAMLTGAWIWLLAPGIALALLITSLTLINFGVDALSNPHLRGD